MKNVLVSSAVCLALLAACDKAVPTENVTPRAKQDVGGGGFDGFDLDASVFTPLDASTPEDAELDDAGAVIVKDAGPAKPESPIIETQTRAFTKRGLLEEAAACARVHYDAFLKHAQELQDTTRAFAQDPSAENLNRAREAWRLANNIWQQADVFIFGPAAQAMNDPGGQGLRDLIYAFPLINTCVVDQSIASKAYEAGLGGAFASARGLGALEYLLFSAAPGNTCSSENNLNKSGAWAAIAPADLAARRAAYAATAASDLLSSAQTLVTAWQPSGGNFAASLTNPTQAPYPTEQAAFNAVSHGLFYLEKEIKDYKLGLPLGLVQGCSGVCPQLLEARYASVAIENIRTNLSAFRKLFQGCGEGGAGLGFDDAMREVGAGSLADEMLTRLANAERVAAAVPGPLQQTVVLNEAAVRALHAAVKALNDLLKVDMVSALNLELPMGAEGDND